MKPPHTLRDGSRMATWLNELLDFCKSIAVVDSPGVRVKRGVNGTELVIRPGSGGGASLNGTITRHEINEIAADYLVCVPVDQDGDATGSEVHVAKPPFLRRYPYDVNATPPGDNILLEYTPPSGLATRRFQLFWLDENAAANVGHDVSQIRTVRITNSVPPLLEFTEVVYPSYKVGDFIFATQPTGGTGIVQDVNIPGSETITWQDCNVDGRHWHWLEKSYEVCVGGNLHSAIFQAGDYQA